MFQAAAAADVTKTVNIGRPRVYHANERQIGGRRPAIAAAATTQLNAADLANDLRNDLIMLGLVSGTPSSGSITANALGTPVSGVLTNCTGSPAAIVYAIVDGAGFSISAANGGIQTLTLGANRTPVGSFSTGQSVLIHVAATSYAITWTDGTLNPTWVGGTAPALSATQQTVIALWKVGSTVYGSLVGYA
jgi:hypothetical protein